MTNSKYPIGTQVIMVKHWAPPSNSDLPGQPAEVGEEFIVIDSDDKAVWLVEKRDWQANRRAKPHGFGPVLISSIKLV